MIEQNTSRKEPTLLDIINKVKFFLNYLISKWVIIISVAFIGSIIGVFYVYKHKAEYTATISFVVDDDKNGPNGLSGIASQFGFDIGGGASGVFSGPNLNELLRSRVLIEKALLRTIILNNNEQTLANYYIQFNKLHDAWKSVSEYDTVNFYKSLDRNKLSLAQTKVLGSISSEIIGKMLNIFQRDKRTSITYISITSHDELFSKYFVESLLKEVSEFYIDTKSRKAKSNVEILERQSDSLRNELNRSYSGVASANDRNYNLNPAYNIERVGASKKQFDLQVNSVMLTQILQNLELAKLSLRKETPLIQTIDTPILPLIKERMSFLFAAFAGGLLAGLIICLILISTKWIYLEKDKLSK